MAKKNIVLGGIGKNSGTPLQENKDGVIVEAVDTPSAMFPKKMWAGFKYHVTLQNLAILDCISLFYDKIINDEVPVPVPEIQPEASDVLVKKSFKIEKDKSIQVKRWIAKNDTTLRIVLTYCIDQFIKDGEKREKENK